jgi:hypothetical protein
MTGNTTVYPKVSGLRDNEIHNNNKHSFRGNTKLYGGKSLYANSQNSDTTAPNGRKLYHLQFSLQAASSETFGYTLVNGYKVLLAKSEGRLGVGGRIILK